jgi:hypothetical protein
MNPDEAMKKLDAQLAKMGYVHPTEADSSRQPQYMAYSVTDDQKTSGMGEYKSHKPYYPYATFNAEETVSDTQRTDICPLCDLKALYSCSCSLSDMMCKQGHIWFVLKNGTVKIGDPHKDDEEEAN